MPSFIKFVSVLCTQNNFRSLKSYLYVNVSYDILKFVRFCRTERVVNVRNGGKLCKKKYSIVRRQAQAALLDYFHGTRNLQFLDAENMSKNSPEFLGRLLKGAGIGDDHHHHDHDGDDVSHSLARFLCYNPINEFEPFFESIGFKPSEYASFLPRNLMFLSDDELLLHNYHVLCNYGTERITIGKIYKEATDVFRYDHGILQLKLQSFQNLGLRKSLLVKIIASSPYLLRGNCNPELLEFLEKLRNVGIGYDWLEEHISEGDSYNWKIMLKLMCLLSDLGLAEEKLREVITNHPDLLLEHSGLLTFRLLVILFKFGSTKSDFSTMFLQFPRMPFVNFINNLSRGYKFLVDIKMSVQDIGRLFRLYPLLVGSCELKKAHSLRFSLSCGNDRLYQMIKDDPFVLKKWVLKLKVDQLPVASRGGKSELPSNPGIVKESKKMKKTPSGNRADFHERLMRSNCVKTKFLSHLGFVKESEEMEKACKVFRGKGKALQDRFDCLVNAGLSWEDVVKMLKVAPNITNQSRDVIERKIGCFVEELGYPISDVATFPELLTYKTERIRLRLLMYKWLKDEGLLKQKFAALSSIVACSEETFVKTYVNSNPRGPEFWERLKETMKPMCEKTKFLSILGFVQESEEMKKVLKVFRGKGKALKERFDCLVNSGFRREDVIGMLKEAPSIFNQSKGTIERKISCLLKELCYTAADVVTYPEIIKYSPERIKLRLLMYEWLKDEGALNQKLALSTLLACTDERFVRNYVNSHPRGPEFWERLKEKIYSI